jgi:hypothetical protein
VKRPFCTEDAVYLFFEDVFCLLEGVVELFNKDILAALIYDAEYGGGRGQWGGLVEIEFSGGAMEQGIVYIASNNGRGNSFKKVDVRGVDVYHQRSGKAPTGGGHAQPMDAGVCQILIDGGYEVWCRMIAEIDMVRGAPGQVIAVDTKVPDLLWSCHMRRHETDESVTVVVSLVGI